MARSIGSGTRLVVLVGFITLALTVSVGKADFAFGPAAILGDTINTADNDNPLCLSPDGLEMYFVIYPLDDPNGADIWVTRRATLDDDWGPPENLGPVVNSPANDSGAAISSDNLTLYICTERPGGEGLLDLWVSTRASTADPWTAPTNLGPVVNSPQRDWGIAVSPDELELYFMSDRPGGVGGELGDIWVTRRASVDDPWGEPENCTVLNSTDSEGYMCMSSDGLGLFFDSDRPGGYGGWDVWFSRRATLKDPWGPPVNLGSTVNTSDTDGLGALSPDGRMLYITTGRPPSRGSMFADIWQLPIVPLVDFNGDGKVDGFEVRTMADRWGTDDSVCDVGPTPLGDGIVDVQDLIALAEYMGNDVGDPTLVAHWALDEAEGETANDSVGENHAAVLGTPVWQPTDGMVGGALLLDGVDDYAAAEEIRDPSEGSMRVFVWIKGGGPGQVIASQVLGANWLMADAASGCLTTELKHSGRMGRALMSEVVITDGDWHRVGLAWDGANRILYADDVVVAADTQTKLVGSLGGLTIGCGKNQASESFWSGLVDDVRVYSRAVKP